MLLYLKREEVPATLFFIDYEKCFDSVSHEAMIGVLRYLNVGEYFILWVEMIYNGFTFCITNNGWASNFIEQQ